ncbi:hypothetical protein TIFTF001_046338 [Ficus carica]|uniref:Uncharacterized protein n=1 Tax=Ficus carica TaxID=3494 RepID=A0AA87ZMN0_FICCA|nr:hypothetical protein TIFTF001_046338 [Ficus carica]
MKGEFGAGHDMDYYCVPEVTLEGDDDDDDDSNYDYAPAA